MLEAGQRDTSRPLLEVQPLQLVCYFQWLVLLGFAISNTSRGEFSLLQSLDPPPQSAPAQVFRMVDTHLSCLWRWVSSWWRQVIETDSVTR